MSIIAEILKELLGMFVSDARLTTAILVLVLSIAALLKWAPEVDSLWAGFALLVGAVVIVVISTSLHAGRVRRSKQR